MRCFKFFSTGEKPVEKTNHLIVNHSWIVFYFYSDLSSDTCFSPRFIDDSSWHVLPLYFQFYYVRFCLWAGHCLIEPIFYNLCHLWQIMRNSLALNDFGRFLYGSCLDSYLDISVFHNTFQKSFNTKCSTQ